MNIPQAAFIVAVLGIMWSIYRLQSNPDVDFNLLDLLLENGKVSKVSCLVMGAFFVTSWIMLDLQFNNNMTEGYMAMYGATWVAPLLVRLFTPGTAATALTKLEAAPNGGKRPEEQAEPPNADRPGGHVAGR